MSRTEGLDQQQQNTEISPEQSPPEGADVQSQETEAQQQDSPKPLPEPDKDKIKKYGLEVEDHETNMDYEDKDYSIES